MFGVYVYECVGVRNESYLDEPFRRTPLRTIVLTSLLPWLGIESSSRTDKVHCRLRYVRDPKFIGRYGMFIHRPTPRHHEGLW